MESKTPYYYYFSLYKSRIIRRRRCLLSTFSLENTYLLEAVGVSGMYVFSGENRLFLERPA